MNRLEDLREWLTDRIDGGEEMRGEDGLISDFIRQIDSQDAELADIKQRLLPQFAGRTQRAEHERDALLEQLIAARSATAALPVEEGAIREALKWCRGAASNDRWSEENLRHQIITRADEALNRSYTR